MKGDGFTTHQRQRPDSISRLANLAKQEHFWINSDRLIPAARRAQHKLSVAGWSCISSLKLKEVSTLEQSDNGMNNARARQRRAWPNGRVRIDEQVSIPHQHRQIGPIGKRNIVGVTNRKQIIRVGFVQ